MGNAQTVGAKLWLTVAVLAGALVVVVGLGTGGFGVWAHLEHVENVEHVEHADSFLLQRAGTLQTDVPSRAEAQRSAAFFREARNTAFIAAPLILLLGLPLVLGLYRWGRWLVR